MSATLNQLKGVINMSLLKPSIYDPSDWRLYCEANSVKGREKPLNCSSELWQKFLREMRKQEEEEC